MRHAESDGAGYFANTSRLETVRYCYFVSTKVYGNAEVARYASASAMMNATMVGAEADCSATVDVVVVAVYEAVLRRCGVSPRTGVIADGEPR